MSHCLQKEAELTRTPPKERRDIRLYQLVAIDAAPDMQPAEPALRRLRRAIRGDGHIHV